MLLLFIIKAVVASWSHSHALFLGFESGNETIMVDWGTLLEYTS